MVRPNSLIFACDSSILFEKSQLYSSNPYIIIYYINYSQIMQKRLRLIQIHQEVTEESINERLQKSKHFSALGPPDLLHITRVKTKTFGKKQTKTTFSFIAGLDIRTPAHLSIFVSQLITLQKQLVSTFGKIQKVCLCIYDVLNQVDLHLEIKIPGSPKISIYSRDGEELKASSLQQAQYYQTAFYSSILRALARRYYPFIRSYEQVFAAQLLQELFPRMLPVLYSKKLKIDSKYLTRSNYGIDLIFEQVLQRNLTRTANIGLKILQQLESNIGNLMVCCLHQEQFQNKKVLELTATCLESEMQTDYLYVQAKSLLKLRKFQKSLKIAKYLILSCKYNNIQSWELLCRCYFYLGNYKDMLVAMNTAASVIKTSKSKIQQWIPIKEEIPTLIYKGNKGFNVSKPTSIQESSLQFNYCIDFGNQFINRFSRMKLLRDALSKQEKTPFLNSLLDKLETALKNEHDSLFDLFKLLVMLERLKGWDNLISIRNRIFWLESDFASVNDALYKDLQQQSSYDGFDPNCQFMQKSMQDISDIKDLKDSKSYYLKEELVEEPYQEPRQTTQQNQIDEKIKPQSKLQQQKQIKLVMSTQCLEEPKNKLLEPPEATTKRFQQPEFIPKHLNEMYLQKILCSEKLQKMILTLYNQLTLLLELDSWQQGLKPPSSYTIDRNQLHSLILLKKSFLQTKLLRFRKSQSSLKKALKYSQYQISRLSIQYHLCLLYLEGRKFKACELYMIEMLTTLFNMGLRQYDCIPFWLLKIIREVIDATGGISEFQQAIKNWPQKLYKIIWQDALINLYAK